MTGSRFTPLFISAAILSLFCACTWTRFDDITANPPVERFNIPDNLSGVGRTVTTFETTTGTSLVATNENELILYDLGAGVDPSRTASTTQICAGDATCVLAQHPAGLRPSTLLDNLGCVAYGIGGADVSSNSSGAQLWLMCENLHRRSLPVPDAFTAWFAANRVSSKTIVTLGTTRRGQLMPLVAAVPDASAIWFYDGLDAAPLPLPALPEGNTAGRSLAVIAVDSGYVILAGSVSRDNTLWLYHVANDRTVAFAGCIEGTAQFGRLMATGQFDDDSIDDLAVTDDTGVAIVSGSSILTVADAASTTCTSIDALVTLGHARCAQLPDLDGCAAAPWAADLATGNLDGIGVDELIVGAPNTSVRGEASAGAVFIQAKNNDGLHVVQGLYVSTAANGQVLGSSVAIAHVSAIDTIIAGAPGDNAVMAFYCNSLVPAQSRSARCP